MSETSAHAAPVQLPQSMPEIRTPRLRLRALEPGDDAALLGILGDAQAMRYWSTAPLTEIAQARDVRIRALRRFEDERSMKFGITLPAADGEGALLIGTCDLFRIDVGNRRAEIGYVLARSHWKRGYALEALTALIDHAFTELRLQRIEADVHPGNEASCRALERLGFRREGLLRERWHVGTEVSDSVIFGLLAREWVRGAVTGQR